MYKMNLCKCTGCMRPAISDVKDGELVVSEYCYKHHTQREQVSAAITSYLQKNDKIVGLNASGMTFSDIDIIEKKLYGCNFRHCFFMGVRSKSTRARLSTFDFAIFTDCNLIQTQNLNVSFAGAKFIHVIFTGSEQIQSNFCGLQSYQSSFDDSNLYQSRFIKANLVDTSFRNCNLKRTIFYEVNQTNISFKLSNTKEAIFDKRGSELFVGEDSSGIIR